MRNSIYDINMDEQKYQMKKNTQTTKSRLEKITFTVTKSTQN